MTTLFLVLVIGLPWLVAAGLALRASRRERDLLASFESEAKAYADSLTAAYARAAERISEARIEAAKLVSSQVQERVAAWEKAQRDKVVADTEARMNVRFDAWKAEYEESIRKDAVARSTSVIRGNVSEQLLPFMDAFPYDPRDCRFIGSPIDLIVFNGLYGDGLKEIVFLEVKTGESSMSPRERAVRNAVRDKMVRWDMVRMRG